MSAITVLKAHLEQLALSAPVADFVYSQVAPREALPVVADYLTRPGQQETVERYEQVFKTYLKALFESGLSSSDARFVAEVTKRVGFVLKFKPYGIKCATVLGYSLFFLKPGMGFSFQRHRTRKTELFHMLDILDRGQIYLSTSQAWDAVYDKDAFNAWLAGNPDERYQAWSRRPNPGEVYLVTNLDTVHTVLGCVLEEFATVSTDMVDRLHDQNPRGECPVVPQATVNEWLAHLPRPLPTDCWSSLAEPPVPLVAERGEGTLRVVLADAGEFLAERYEVEAGRTLVIPADKERGRSLFCLGGASQVTLAAAGEAPSEPILLKAGEVIIVGPNVSAVIAAEAAVSISAHTIRPGLALD